MDGIIFQKKSINHAKSEVDALYKSFLAFFLQNKVIFSQIFQYYYSNPHTNIIQPEFRCMKDEGYEVDSPTPVSLLRNYVRKKQKKTCFCYSF